MITFEFYFGFVATTAIILFLKSVPWLGEKSSSNFFFFYLFGCCMAFAFTAIGLSGCALFILSSGGHVLLPIIVNLLLFLVASSLLFPTSLRDSIGDMLGKARCYGCGHSFLLKENEKSISVNDGCGVIVCRSCYDDPKRIHPVLAYSRMIRAGFSRELAHQTEKALTA